jgi:hypothetical protein
MSAGTTKPVIFLAFANDRDRYLRNLPEEARQLQRVLGEARRAGLCELVLRGKFGDRAGPSARRQQQPGRLRSGRLWRESNRPG